MKMLRLLAAALATSLALAESAAAADQIVVTDWGGTQQVIKRQVFFEPFAKASGIKVIEDEWNGEVAKLRAMVQSKSVTWDVVLMQSSSSLLLCGEGMLERLDWKKLGLDRSRFIASDLHDCGVPTNVNSTVFAYDKDRLPNGPKTIKEFFDTTKFPGKRGLWKNAYGNLEWALAADGVPYADVYKVLRTPEGVDRAFRKLDTVKKDVIWWTSGAQPVQMLADGQVVMTAAWIGRVVDAVLESKKNFQVVWDAQLWGNTYWSIPKGSQHMDAAYKFIAYVAQPKVESLMSKHTSYGPANRDAAPYVNPAMVPYLASTPEHLKEGFPIDPAFWSERGDELRQRFNAWVAR